MTSVEINEDTIITLDPWSLEMLRNGEVCNAMHYQIIPDEEVVEPHATMHIDDCGDGKLCVYVPGNLDFSAPEDGQQREIAAVGSDKVRPAEYCDTVLIYPWFAQGVGSVTLMAEGFELAAETV